jgi:hypothetical protein
MEIKLPFPVSVNDMYLNNKGRGRGRKPSPEYEAWKLEAGHRLNRQHPGLFKPRAIVFISIDDKRQGDADNRAKPVLDLLVTHGVLAGDSKRHVKRVSIGWEAVEGCQVKLLGVE